MEYYRSTGGFTCSAAGAGKERTVPSTGHWAAIWVTAYAADTSGIWQTGEAGHPYLQNAASAVMGPVVLQPGQPMVTQISGATANVDTTIEYRGWFSDVGDGSDLTGIIGTEITSGSITLPTPVPVSDGGLAGSVASSLSILNLFNTYSLTSGATTTISVGAGTATAFPQQVGSWVLQIVGMAGAWSITPGGVRVYWTGQDVSANVIYTRQRDSSQYIYGSLTLSGDVDAPAIIWQITLPGSAPGGCIARLFFSAAEITDSWYDTAIYGPVFTDYESQALGMDGTLLAINGASIPASNNQTFKMPTYRGPVEIDIQSSQASHIAVYEADYTGTLLRSLRNIPLSASGQNQLSTIIYLAGLYNQLIVFNDFGGGANTIFGEFRAIKDLV